MRWLIGTRLRCCNKFDYWERVGQLRQKFSLALDASFRLVSAHHTPKILEGHHDCIFTPSGGFVRS